jgi:hypothetical protein
MTDAVTIVRCRPGLLLAKRITPDGIRSYDNAKHVDLLSRQVDGLGDLGELLRLLAPRPRLAVVRGEIIDPGHTRNVRRLLYADRDTGEPASLKPVPRLWLALDIDGIPAPSGLDITDLIACAKVAAARLPSAFHQTSLIVQPTASHGIAPGLRLRLWCWLSRPTSDSELKFWLKAAPVDQSVFGASQLIYTGSPVFESGAADPLPERLAVLFGQVDAVAVPDPVALQPPVQRNYPPPLAASDGRADGYARNTMAFVAGAVMRAPVGKRHDTIVVGARRLAELERHGLVLPAETEELLVRAARGCRLDQDRGEAASEDEIRKIIAWARRSCRIDQQGGEDVAG